MKRNNRFVCAMMFFLFVCVFSTSNAKATINMPVDMKGFSKVMNVPGALAFWGKVIEVKDAERGKEYVFEVKEVLKGNVQDKTVALKFVGPRKSSGQVQAVRDISLPNLYPDYEVVLFVIPTGGGYYVISGGEGQGLFYVKYYDGKPAVYNALGNQNIIQLSSNDSTMQSVISQMRKENTGAIDLDNFKKLFNEAK